MRRFAMLLLALTIATPAAAVEPGEVLDDPALESRAREMSKELRCLVCQNQSIDDSNAGLAKDLRVLVRERLVAGDSDAEVMAFVTDRYGDFVRLRPPMKPYTLGLWLGPAIVLLLGGGGLALWYRARRTTPATAPLNPRERERLHSLMAGFDGDGPGADGGGSGTT